MPLKIEDFHPKAGQVQTKRKYATFTVKEIGGPAEIIEWRKAQAAKLEAAGIAYNQFKQDVALHMVPDDAPVGDANWTGAASLSKQSWEEKIAFAQSERERLKKPVEVEPIVYDFTPEPEPKKSPLERVIGWVKAIWASANF